MRVKRKALTVRFWFVAVFLVTSSGEQVIIAGVLVALLIFIFYGLQIFYGIRQWRNRSSTKKEINTKLTSSKFSTVTKVKRSRLIESSTIFILTFLVGSASIIVKYFLIKPIHQEMIEKFQTNESLFFQRHKFCQIFDVTNEFNIIIFPASCGLFLILCLISKRVSFGRSRCWFKFIGLPIPMDFFFHFKRTFAAVIFAIFADEFLEIANEIFKGDDSDSNEGNRIILVRSISRWLIRCFLRHYFIVFKTNIQSLSHWFSSLSNVSSDLYRHTIDFDLCYSVHMARLCYNNHEDWNVS